MKNLWQTNKYIPIRGYRFYYKHFFLYKIAKPLNLPCWRKWKNKKNRIKHKLRTRNTKGKRKILLRKVKYCYVCGKELKDDATIEHIIPKSKLKDKKLYDNMNNLSLSHYKCNNLKADK